MDNKTAEQITAEGKAKLEEIKARYWAEKGKEFRLSSDGAGLVPQHIYDAYMRDPQDPDYKPLPPDHPDFLQPREEAKG